MRSCEGSDPNAKPIIYQAGADVVPYDEPHHYWLEESEDKNYVPVRARDNGRTSSQHGL